MKREYHLPSLGHRVVIYLPFAKPVESTTSLCPTCWRGFPQYRGSRSDTSGRTKSDGRSIPAGLHCSHPHHYCLKHPVVLAKAKRAKGKHRCKPQCVAVPCQEPNFLEVTIHCSFCPFHGIWLIRMGIIAFHGRGIKVGGPNFRAAQ